jgi:hypothetical protein
VRDENEQRPEHSQLIQLIEEQWFDRCLFCCALVVNIFGHLILPV